MYGWNTMEMDNFAWWSKRMKATAKWYAVIRFDHFIDIVRYYNIPLDRVPKEGHFEKGPGMKLILAIDSVIGETKVIAEDLGGVVPEVSALLEESGYPGMNVFEFSFDGNPSNAKNTLLILCSERDEPSGFLSSPWTA